MPPGQVDPGRKQPDPLHTRVFMSEQFEVAARLVVNELDFVIRDSRIASIYQAGLDNLFDKARIDKTGGAEIGAGIAPLRPTNTPLACPSRPM